MHGTVSTLTNRFLSVSGIRTLGSGRRFFLAIAGLFVATCWTITVCQSLSIYWICQTPITSTTHTVNIN